MDVKDKKITVLGVGQSGFDAALFLKRHGARVFVSDAGDSEELRVHQETLAQEGIACEIGKHTLPNIIDSSFVIISPGISPRTEIYQALHTAQVEILSEIELAFRFFTGDIIAVTGTDGKTTVTTLIREILCGLGENVVSCGNIGNPFIGEVEKVAPGGKVVLEVSSFQLYHIKQFRPKVAVLLNVAPDHLDWHYNFKDYVDAKQRLFENQTRNDYAILNFQDQVIQKMLCRIKARQLFFNQFPTDMDANRDAALEICDVYQLDRQRAEEIVRAFGGVEHRLEHVPAPDGFFYINDSKSTSLHSLVWALDSMKEKVVLICGGRNKGLDFTSVCALIRQKVKLAIVLGEAKEEIVAAWQECAPCVTARDVGEAIAVARRKAQKGETILFSPACTSFDMFSNYKERGKVFKEVVRQATGEINRN